MGRKQPASPRKPFCVELGTPGTTNIDITVKMGGNGNSQNTTGNWVSGKDFQFNYLGNNVFPINGVTFDYIQVWESGSKVNTTRLEYLINNRLSNDSYDAAAWTNYDNAVKAGETLLSDVTIDQAKVDSAVLQIMDTRNKLTKAGTTAIHTVELVTGDYARVGMQTGLRVVTSPDITALTVTGKTLIVCSSQPQKLLIGGEDTDVKVWLITFDGSTQAGTVDYTISAKGGSTVTTTVTVAYSSFVNE